MSTNTAKYYQLSYVPKQKTDDACDYGFLACQLVLLERVWYRVLSSFQAEGAGEVSTTEIIKETLLKISPTPDCSRNLQIQNLHADVTRSLFVL